MTDSPKQRREVFYSGRVQGVGFRITVLHISQGREVVGFVRNLTDGRVQLVAEGTDDALKDFLSEVERRMRRNIEESAVTESPATGEFQEFNVRG